MKQEGLGREREREFLMESKYRGQWLGGNAGGIRPNLALHHTGVDQD